MNPHLTEVAFILDRSGSMQSVTEQAIAGFNHFLAEQQRAPGQARLTLVLFDDEYLLHADALSIAEVMPLDTTTYVPRASTALLDAIGRTIDDLGKRLAATPEADRPAKVIVTILTDGEENASTRYAWRDISKRVRHQTDKYGWEFLFLGANQDAIATAAQMSIAAHNSATYAADGVGTMSGTAALARKSRAIRSSARPSAPPSAAEAADLAASMSELLREEDQQRRGEE